MIYAEGLPLAMMPVDDLPIEPLDRAMCFSLRCPVRDYHPAPPAGEFTALSEIAYQNLVNKMAVD